MTLSRPLTLELTIASFVDVGSAGRATRVRRRRCGNDWRGDDRRRLNSRLRRHCRSQASDRGPEILSPNHVVGRVDNAIAATVSEQFIFRTKGSPPSTVVIAVDNAVCIIVAGQSRADDDSNGGHIRRLGKVVRDVREAISPNKAGVRRVIERSVGKKRQTSMRTL